MSRRFRQGDLAHASALSDAIRTELLDRQVRTALVAHLSTEHRGAAPGASAGKD
jgi:hypothetical protein